MTGVQRGKGPMADINVTPLVDVMMVLLILFMVVAQLDDRPPAAAVPVELPRANNADTARAPQPLTVAVAADGRLFVRGAQASEGELRAAVAAVLAANPEAEVAVGADRQAPHERFVGLLDLLRSQGVVKFAIQADAEGHRGG